MARSPVPALEGPPPLQAQGIEAEGIQVQIWATVDAFGKHVVMDDGIPVITDDFVSDAQTQGAATTCSSISAVRFEMESMMGVQIGERQVVDVGDLGTKDAGRWRISD